MRRRWANGIIPIPPASIQQPTPRTLSLLFMDITDIQSEKKRKREREETTSVPSSLRRARRDMT